MEPVCSMSIARISPFLPPSTIAVSELLGNVKVAEPEKKATNLVNAVIEGERILQPGKERKLLSFVEEQENS